MSDLIETPALLAPGDTVPQPAFLNGAIALQTDLGPFALLAALREIERSEGRPVARARWQPRTLDLDILLYGEQVLDTPQLKVPHPPMHQRRYVLAPLVALDPSAMHPVIKRTVRELLARV